MDGPYEINVSGGFIRKEQTELDSTCDGIYVRQEGFWREKCRYRRCVDGNIVKGAIFFDGTRWKIWRRGTGTGDDGWNFSQTTDDLDSLFPPMGRWVKLKGHQIDSLGENNYEELTLTSHDV